MPAIMGGCWVLVATFRDRARPSRGVLLGALLACSTYALLSLTGPAEGPISTGTERLLGTEIADIAWPLLMAALALGWLLIPAKLLLATVVALAGQAVIFLQIPFWFERLAWWSVVATLILLGRQQSGKPGRAPGMAVLVAAWVFGVLGYIAYALFGRL